MFIPNGNGPTFIYRTCSIARAALVVLLCTLGAAAQTIYDSRKSERSDKLTGGHIEHAEFAPASRTFASR